MDRQPGELIEELVSDFSPSTSPSAIPHQHQHAAINPATIPIRTSSSNATLNGDRDSHSLRRLSRGSKNLSSLPEDRRYSFRPIVDERNWLSQGRSSSSHNRLPHSPTSSISMNQNTAASPRSAEISRMLGSEIIERSGSQWSPEKENILRGPYDYLEAQPGKDIRTQLIAAFNEWLRVPASSLTIITHAVGMLHTASLLVDDVEDNSTLRRGNPVAHSIFGTAQTINSANYMYFCALEELMKLNSTDVVRIYTEELLNLHRGQGMDLFWRDTLTCPSEEDYLEMVGNKTGGLFRLAVKLMCAESPSHHFDGMQAANNPDEPSAQADYIPLVNTIGLLFQILDDYRNLSDTTYTANKGLCEDLTEGKFSFPIIHAIRSDPSNLQLINILRQKTTDDDVKRYALAYMESTGSFSYTRRVLRGLTKKALALVDELDAGHGKTDVIRGILEKLRVDRNP